MTENIKEIEELLSKYSKEAMIESKKDKSSKTNNLMMLKNLVIENEEQQALVNFNNQKDKILKTIVKNIYNYQNNAWSKKNITLNAFPKQKENILSIKAPYEVFKVDISGVKHQTNEDKITLLKQIGNDIIANKYDDEIKGFLIERQNKRNAKIERKKALKEGLIWDIVLEKMKTKMNTKNIAIHQPKWDEKYNLDDVKKETN